MTSEPQPRPGQATLAGALIIGGSIVVVLTAWARISSLHTIEAQEELQRVLREPPFAGLSLDTLSTTDRVLCLVAAGAATAATILGFQVYKRSASARLVLTLLAPLILIGGFATEGFFAPMVVAGITMLWLQPTRDWYAGRPWAQRPRRADRLAALQSPPLAPGPTGAAPGPEGAAQQPLPLPDSHGAAQSEPPPVVRRRRPPSLVWACALSAVTSTLVAIGLVSTALAAAVQRDEVMDEFRSQQGEALEASGLTEDALLAALFVMIGALVLWALAAVALAWLAFTGRNWARITLAVSAVCASALALALAIASPPLVLLVASLATSTWLLLRADTAAWFRR